MANEFATGNEIVDFDLLRRLGVLPLNPGDTGAALPEFPVVNTGPHFGPTMEAELGGPYGMPSGQQRSPLDSTVQESPAASQPAGQPSGLNFLPWTTPEGIARLPIMPRGGGQVGITAPEGTASWTPANPTDTTNWMKQKLAEQTANRAASERRAEVQARLEIYKQREVEQQQQMAREQQMNQNQRLQELARTNPVEYLNQVAKLQTNQATIAQQQNEGSAEAQAFRKIAATEGLPAALAWLQQNEIQKQRAALTPEQRFTNTLAETMGRYGPQAQALRAQTAEGNAAAGIRGQLQGVGQGVPGVAPGTPGVAAVAHAKAAGAPIPVSERDTLSAMNSVLGIVNDLDANWETVKQYVGPIRGRAGAVGESYGGVLGIPEISEEEATYRAAAQDANNRMIYFLTGKQINQEEAKRLGLVMPSMDLPEPTFHARLRRFKDNIGKLMNARIDLQTASAQDIRTILSGGVVTSQTSTPSPVTGNGGWGIKQRGQ